MKNNLAKKGLSMSQAQSISNLCNQRAEEIENTLNMCNNSSKTLTIAGKEYPKQIAYRLPANVLESLTKLGQLRACQAFLMQNIKLKGNLILSKKNEKFVYTIPEPKAPVLEKPNTEVQVDEEWAWDMLSKNEINEYLEVEAMAAHLGKFIHKGGKLATLRKEFPIEMLEFIELEEGKKTPIEVVAHHTAEKLLEIHEEIASEHRKYEQRVNFYKAKIKNLVSTENAEIDSKNSIEIQRVNKINRDLNQSFIEEMRAHAAAKEAALKTFESKKLKELKDIVNLRIEIDPRFQPVIDLFLDKVEEKEVEK